LTHSRWPGHDRLGARFSVREQAGVLPIRSPAVARQGAGELETVHLRTGPGSGRARPRHGARPSRVQPLPRPAPADGVLRAAARHRAPAAHRLGDGTGSPALSASATTARATATAAGRSGAVTQTTQMTSSAACALTTLASATPSYRWRFPGFVGGCGSAAASIVWARAVRVGRGGPRAGRTRCLLDR
jgi:hypothetical protein